MVGNVTIGSEHPIRIQTMTTTDTKDVAATVEQVMRIADSGADIIRITVQGQREADACFEIKNTLIQKNYNIPLVADIHFTPSVAMRVADCFDKIRVNPGNFADRRAQFEQLEYTDYDYQKELEHIEKEPFEEKHRRYFDFQRRAGQLPIQKEGEEVDYRNVLHRDGSVLMSVSLEQLKTPELLYKSLGAKLIVGMPFKDLATVDSILMRKLPSQDDNVARLALKRLVDVSMGIITPLSEQLTKPLPHAIVLVNLKELSTGAYKLLPEGTRLAVSVRGDEPYDELDILKDIDATMLLHELPFSEEKISRVHAARRLFEYLSDNSLNFPVIHHIQFPTGAHRDDLVIRAGTCAGALLVDGLGDGVLLEAPDQDFEFLRNTSFNLLQGCRMRNTKTEYVSCPSCGRTLFDLQEISAQIREKTSHLPGVSIAIMGCIVNGPGEMADADFGYVGGAPGKIDLYVGKTVVKRAIEMEHATDALIDLIKEHGRWVDPPVEE